ncbi:MAG TPA: 6-phosphogluconolactonase [Actinomycetota bacterium]|jgi:6-phosphogluconolactonase|nr:6-phosphogluconolactonase [Actinomycetota bacterium]
MTTPHELEVLPDPEAVARRGAEVLAAAARAAVSERGRFVAAVSGGHTPWDMFARLGAEDMPWDRVDLWQVDERVAPDGGPERNLTNLVGSLPSGAVPVVHAMPVGDRDLDAAASRYAAALPTGFDLMHLGLGDDGHTASLVPGDPVLDVMDRDVAVTGPYRGRRRMTLTYPAIARAGRLLWLITGGEKAWALARLLSGDPSIPAGRVRVANSLVLADEAAAGPPRP